MLSRFREPGGKFTLIAAGIACLVLAGLSAGLPLGGANWAVSVVLLGAALFCFWRSWAAAREERYDLKRLFDAPPPEPEEPRYDHVPEDEDSAPYCGWCDEAYPPGTYRCTRCCRPLG